DSSEVGLWRSGGGPDLATLTEPLKPGEIARRVDRRRSLAQFEVQLRRIDVARIARLGDHLPALDRFAPLHIEFAVVAISRDEAVRMLDEYEVAVTFKSVARVDDRAALRRPNRGSGRDGNVDAVVAAGLEPLNDAAARRPAEFRLGSGGVALRAGQRGLRLRRPRFEVACRRLIDRRPFGLRRLGRLGLSDRSALGLRRRLFGVLGGLVGSLLFLFVLRLA